MLKRTFFTLYFCIVLVILLAGWGLDRLHQALTDENATTQIDRAFLSLLAKQAQPVPAHQQANFLRTTLDQLGLDARVYSVTDLSDSSLGERLLAGKPLLLDADDGRELYAPLESLPFILRISLTEHEDISYQFLLVAFYLILAITIYLWVWPLVRDLKTLEAHAKDFGQQESSGEPVALGTQSPVYLLANEFNRMQARINELLASYKEMTYAVSHELRTPLARMKFALELAQSQTTLEGVGRHLASVRQDVADMDDLINQFLNYAGFESQTQSLVQQVGAAGALRALVDSLIARLREQDSTVTFDVIDQLGDEEVYCEWHLFERVLHNLLSNARRYAESNVRVELYRKGNCYAVSVEDDGPGIPEAMRERVFDSFVRLKQLPGKDTKGFGLGLAIVKRIMGWHNGDVCIEDPKCLGGARFECFWPTKVH